MLASVEECLVPADSHTDTRWSMTNLALTYPKPRTMEGGGGVAGASDGGRHEGAGTGAPKHAESMANLASTYRNQGRRKEAEGLEVQVFVTAVTECRVGSRNHHFDSEIEGLFVFNPWLSEQALSGQAC